MHVSLELPKDLDLLRSLYHGFFPDTKVGVKPEVAEKFSPAPDEATVENTETPDGAEADAPPAETKPAPEETAPEETTPRRPTAESLIEGLGLKVTQSTALADGMRGIHGMAVTLQDGSAAEVHATARGKVVIADEDGKMTVVDASTVASDGAHWQEADDANADATPPAETKAPETPPAEADTSDLPDDYLLTEMKEVGGKLRNAVNVAALFACLHGVHEGAARMSDVPVEKRDALLDAMNAALAEAKADVLT